MGTSLWWYTETAWALKNRHLPQTYSDAFPAKEACTATGAKTLWGDGNSVGSVQYGLVSMSRTQEEVPGCRANRKQDGGGPLLTHL